MNFINNTIIKTIPLLPKKMVKIIADQYVAGETIKSALEKVNYLNSKNYNVTVDLLGEHITNANETKNITNIYLEILKQIKNSNLSSNISIKPTHIGLDINIDTFNLEEEGDNIDGEIYISIEDVLENSKTYNITFNNLSCYLFYYH